MTLGEFLKTQKGISSFGLYIADRKTDNIIETQLSLATALIWENEKVAYANYFIADDKVRACIYISLRNDER